MSNQTKANKGVFEAIISGHKRIGEQFHRLSLQLEEPGAKAFVDTKPGQFAQLDLADTALPPKAQIPEQLWDAAQRKILLRRPFSFCSVSAKGQKTFMDILYSVVGPATVRMTTLSAGDSITVIGPLGNGFRIPVGKKRALLVSGGMGVGPLMHLAKVLTDKRPDIEIFAFAGAKTAKKLPYEKPLDEISQQLGFTIAEFARYGVCSQVATDDGSAGYNGFVTNCVEEWIGQNSSNAGDTIIYSCGPEKMLAGMAKIAQKHNIECQLSMEQMMACGIGICQSCAVECKVPESGETVYKMCCTDGPVFDSREVVFKL